MVHNHKPSKKKILTLSCLAVCPHHQPTVSPISLCTQFLCIGQNRSVFIKERIIHHGLDTSPSLVIPSLHRNASQTAPRSRAGRKHVETKQQHTDSFLKGIFMINTSTSFLPTALDLLPVKTTALGELNFRIMRHCSRGNEKNGETFCFPHMKERNR